MTGLNADDMRIRTFEHYEGYENQSSISKKQEGETDTRRKDSRIVSSIRGRHPLHKTVGS